MSVDFKVASSYDPKKARLYLNKENSVYHCHHYAALFTQLAEDSKLLHGPKLLFEATEEAFYPVIKSYFDDNKISDIKDRRAIAEDYFSFVGFGKVKINIEGDGGSAIMPHSHVDEGWIKKWKKYDKPINFIGQGFLAAAFSAILGKAVGTFNVKETQSIVMGDKESKFTITKK